MYKELLIGWLLVKQQTMTSRELLSWRRNSGDQLYAKIRGYQ